MTVRRNNSKRDPNLRFNMYPDDDQHFVNVITAGSTIIATPTTKLRKNSRPDTVPYDKEHRINKETGEITPVKHSLEGSHFQNIYRTISKINGLALTNFTGDDNEAFITLTYASPEGHTLQADNKIFSPAIKRKRQANIKTINSDLKNYLNKLKYYFKSLGTGIKYLVLIQPHASGQVHFHLLIKIIDGSNINPHIDKLKSIWKLGYSDIKDVKHIRSLAAYLSSTMLNDDVDPDNPDKLTKYARINYYPTGMHIYRASNNLEKPDKKIMTYPELDKLIAGKKPTFISQTASEYEGITYNHLRATWENLNLHPY